MRLVTEMGAFGAEKGSRMQRLAITRELSEQSLASALQQLTGDDWLTRTLKVPGTRRSCDMAFRSSSGTTAVEFDGPDHYCNSLKIKKDREKDELLTQHGIRCVRFPFWVQLDTATAFYYFGLEADITTDFPHGFITTTCFPASFCELGIMRFEKELAALPSEVTIAVVGSLRHGIDQYGLEYVLPTSLRHMAQ